MPEFDPFQVSYDAQGIPIDTGWVPDEDTEQLHLLDDAENFDENGDFFGKPAVGFGACETAEYPRNAEEKGFEL